MNFLAHFYLAYPDEHLIMGNFIADFIGNRELPYYTEAVQRGVRLHRAIDSFTDTHPVVRQSTRRLHAHFHKYAPVITDIYYDYILVQTWQQYSTQVFHNFIAEIYAILQKNKLILFENLQVKMERMIAHNWLVQAATLDGLHVVFDRITKRPTDFPMDFSTATDVLETHLTDFSADFDAFFPDLIAFVETFEHSKAF